MPELMYQSVVFGPPGAAVRAAARPLAVRVAHVARVAAAQWGVIDDDQLRECGIGAHAIARWVAAGRLHPRYPGVYAYGHAALPIEGELTAALLAAGPGGALSHATAAWWWGLIEKPPRVIEISVPRRRRATPGIKLHHPRELITVPHRRLPVTPPIQTLRDFASGATVEQTRRAIAEGEYLRLVDVADISTALGRGRPGSATLRRALTRHQPQLARSQSELEKAFIALCEWANIPVPEFNKRICGYLVDAVWLEQRVAVELDGLDNHRTPAQLERDHERDLVLRQNSFETRRYTWRQVTRKRARVVADLPSSIRELAA